MGNYAMNTERRKRDYPLISPKEVIVCIVVGLIISYGVYQLFFK